MSTPNPQFPNSRFQRGTIGTHRELIRASEIGEYAYCARAWWLRRVKWQRSANVAAMQRGQARHREHGGTVERYHLMRRLAQLLLLLAVAALRKTWIAGWCPKVVSVYF